MSSHPFYLYAPLGVLGASRDYGLEGLSEQPNPFPPYLLTPLAPADLAPGNVSGVWFPEVVMCVVITIRPRPSPLVCFTLMRFTPYPCKTF